MNDENLAFYENLGVNPFMELAIKGGFHSFIDLELVFPYIKDAKSILELGAGYGRCIDFLLEKKFEGKIFAVEQSNKLIQYLNNQYAPYPNVTIVKSDIKLLQLGQKVDVALWMWSGIIDFAPEEQMECVKNLASMMNDNGFLVIDIPRIGYKTYALHKDLQNLSLVTPFGKLDCYIPDLKDIQKYCSYAGLSQITTMDYKTTTDKERTLYIIKK